MGRILRILAWLSAALTAAPLGAQTRDFCTDAPGIETPRCIVNAGEALLEVTPYALHRNIAGGVRTDVHAFADSLLRLGLDDRTEVQLGLAAFGRTVVTAPGNRTSVSGLGDSYLALRRTVTNAGPLTAVEVYASLPTGANGVGAGSWSAGLVLPLAVPSSAALPVHLNPQIGLAPDADGAGHHLAYGGLLGVTGSIAPRLVGVLELSALRDDDPAGRSFTAAVAATLAWQIGERTQLNFEVGRALDENALLIRGGIALRL